MPGPLPLQAELSAMKDELAHTSAERRTGGGDAAADLLRALEDIDWAVPDDVKKFAANADKLFKDYPYVTLASAFLAGLIVGRLSRTGS